MNKGNTTTHKARQRRIRAKVNGTAERPRLAVFRSNTALTAQMIDDVQGVTLAAVSTKGQEGKTFGERVVAAGAALGKLAKDKGIVTVVFDRGGFAYTGNVKAFADAVREMGIKF